MIEGPYRLMTSINLDRHEILVVGGGAVGERKIHTLTEAGAAVTLVSPEATGALRALAESGAIRWERRDARAEDFSRFSFALLALPPEPAQTIAALARERGCLICVCADGASGDFALCAQFERDGCRVGISSGGVDPARAANLKRELTGERDSFVLLSRRSPLALAQTNLWQEVFTRAGLPTRIRTVTPHGDRDRERDLSAFGGFGAFVKALEEEMLAGRGDGAVHSLKDMPAILPEGCELMAVLPRASAFDVLIARDPAVRSLEDLPPGARVGTSSARRRAQVRFSRRDLRCGPCRGNIGTRLDKLARGEFDALILAEAGLDRLGLTPSNALRLPFVTAAGQGALAFEAPTRPESAALAEAAQAENHLPTWYEITAERELLRLMGLGCSCPVGVHGSWTAGKMELKAEIYPIETETASDEPLITSASAAVASDDDAKGLAAALWQTVRTSPLVEGLRKAAEQVPCL